MNKYLKLYESHSQYVEPEIKPNVSYCKQENEVHYNPIDWSKEYFTIESLEDNNTIYLKASNSAVTKTVSVSTDNGTTWTEYTSSKDGSGTTLATLNKGDRLLVKGGNETYATSSYYNQFKSTKQFEIKGNIMSLVSGNSFANADELTETFTFTRLFNGCTGLTSAENLILPATTLANNCYNYMFYNCTSLTTAPELPATTLTLGCYSSMFSSCANLTTAPELPATTLAQYCYSNMFNGCTNLTVAPELPATTLANSCYNYMFNGCKSLTIVPELPATTLASNCYSSMFEGCTSLTTAPELPATTLTYSCYRGMFQGCSNLNYIKAMFTTTPSGGSPNYYTQNWVKNVASTGTFVKNTAATWNVTGDNGIPNGWTVQDETT